MKFEYYIYAYLRKDGTPYYIGKGRKKRAWDKNHSWPIPADKSRIIIMEQNLSNIGACALERFYIRWYGRIDNETGILRNMTDGGEGFSGKHSTQTKRKMSLSHKGKIKDEKWRKSLSQSLKDKKKSDEHSEKCRLNGAKSYIIIDNQGLKHNVFCLKDFCLKNNLDYHSMWRVANGLRKQHKKYRIEKV